ncbi:Hemolymph lipopolysaccharide-binding protein [Dufourea novaeangliae]|uniref:Hemolymph lipopolysaccharide-binding protein n=2 Tax=Dufourea novaeangliae TaxID=178035 RepID=A0A154PEK8_DUFNO|nr:Hemolymph lipopolysaccharide-binding protein [Dufourea novaeangliae]
MICSCEPGTRRIPVRDDYLFTPDIGSHKFHMKPTTWNNARRTCSEEGGHLAIVNSKAEAQVLTKIFDQAGPVIGAAFPDEAFLGIHDLYMEGDWVTILGDPLAKTGYSWWSEKWGGQPDNGGGVQNCGAILKDGKLDDVQCEANFPFFCELPLVNYI